MISLFSLSRNILVGKAVLRKVLVNMHTKKVIVIPWQPDWQENFYKLRNMLQIQLDGLVCAIEHIGSTSVPGLPAKPILDVDVVIPNRELFGQVKAKLEEIGYFHRGDLGVLGREAFGYSDKRDLMCHHLYVLAQDSDELRRHLGFRDWLRTHPVDAEEYARVKLDAAERFSGDIEAYIDAKSDFILQIYQKAGLTDPTNLFENAWSVLINCYGLRVTDLECKRLESGIHGCEVSAEEKSCFLLAWEKDQPELAGCGLGRTKMEWDASLLPTASGKAICETSHFVFALFENDGKAKEFLRMNNQVKEVDNTQKFSGKAEIYQKARSSYAAGLFQFLQHDFHLGAGSMVADVGSGTGILTRQLLEMDVKVFAVEPNADMRKVAEEQLGKMEGFIPVAATAEQTTLANESVDFVFAASAFHWFDPLAFKVECNRILKPGGKVFLIWNETQVTDEIEQGRKAVFEKYSGKPAGGHKEKPGVKEIFFDGQVSELRLPNPITYDKQCFIGRALSSSYSLTEMDENYEEFIAELDALFNHFAVDGLITVSQETVLYYKA